MTFNLRYVASLLVVVHVLFYMAEANAQRSWINLGNSSLGPWEIFIDKDSVKKLDNEIYAAITYQDLGVMQRGLDEYGAKGQFNYNTKIRYRSYRSVDFYDCRNGRISNLETRYYTSARPEKDALVHKVVEEKPIWLPKIIEPKIFRFVCNIK